MPYPLSIRARDLVNGGAPQISVEASITRQIRLLLYSKQGECRYDTAYGSGLWENDFDLDASTAEWRDRIKRTIQNVLTQYEPRLHITDFVVEISDETMVSGIKKCLVIEIKGQIKDTNQAYHLRESVLLNPLA